MKLFKDKVIKDIPKHLVSHYIALGWKEYKEIKEEKRETPKKESGFKSIKIDKINYE